MAELYPGESLGLPQSGRGALASWTQRIAALIGDWAACTVVAIGLFGWGVTTDKYGSFMVLGTFFVESCILTVLSGATFGQLIAGIGVVRLNGQPLGIWVPVVRTAMKCIVIPVVVVGAERRHLADILLGTAVVRRRDLRV